MPKPKLKLLKLYKAAFCGEQLAQFIETRNFGGIKKIRYMIISGSVIRDGNRYSPRLYSVPLDD